MNLAEWSKGGRGRQAELARICGVRQPVVVGWVGGRRPVPVRHAWAIERATSGAVTRRDLRPDDWQDIWPELADPQPNTAPAPAQQAPAAINSEALRTGQEVAHV